jgi:hypothetical protein
MDRHMLRFIEDTHSRDDMRELLAVGSYRNPSKPFPLMDLPVELRIMVAK